MSVEVQTRRVYYATTKRRAYLTKRSAIRAEAVAMLKYKYPTEKAEYDDMGRETYKGAYWRDYCDTIDPDYLLRRLMRWIARRMEVGAAP